MTNPDPNGPWNDIASPTALPPSVATDNTTPWEDAGASPTSISPQAPPQSVSPSIVGMVGQALAAQPGQLASFMTDPVAQAKALPVLGGIAGGISGLPGGATIGNVGGNLLADAALKTYGKSDEIPPVRQQVTEGLAAGASDLVGPVKSFFTVPDSLKSAGINATTLDHMAPSGQPPGDWAKAVEKQLQSKGVIANTANDTWKLMSTEANKVGGNISDLLAEINKASPEALQVDAQTALQPLDTKVKQIASNMYSEAQTVAEPYQEAHNFLTTAAQQQGGKLTLDNIDTALQHTGEMMNGGEAAIEKYGPVYGKLADVRDTIVQNVANQSESPALASNLLKNNADYSTYMRLLPTIEKSGYREAIKEGVSAYQKYVGPLGEKMLAAGGVYGGMRAAMDKILGER